MFNFNLSVKIYRSIVLLSLNKKSANARGPKRRSLTKNPSSNPWTGLLLGKTDCPTLGQGYFWESDAVVHDFRTTFRKAALLFVTSGLLSGRAPAKMENNQFDVFMNNYRLKSFNLQKMPSPPSLKTSVMTFRYID